MKNILHIQVKLELSENLAVAPMQRFHEIKRPRSKDTKAGKSKDIEQKQILTSIRDITL